MAVTRHVQHIKSVESVTAPVYGVNEIGPKLPTADDLMVGEIGINYGQGHETISIKNSNGEIKTFTNDDVYLQDEAILVEALGQLKTRLKELIRQVEEMDTAVAQSIVTHNDSMGADVNGHVAFTGVPYISSETTLRGALITLASVVKTLDPTLMAAAPMLASAPLKMTSVGETDGMDSTTLSNTENNMTASREFKWNTEGGTDTVSEDGNDTVSDTEETNNNPE